MLRPSQQLRASFLQAICAMACTHICRAQWDTKLLSIVFFEVLSAPMSSRALHTDPCTADFVHVITLMPQAKPPLQLQTRFVFLYP